jgi:hypothetical protein
MAVLLAAIGVKLVVQNGQIPWPYRGGMSRDVAWDGCSRWDRIQPILSPERMCRETLKRFVPEVPQSTLENSTEKNMIQQFIFQMSKGWR